MARIKTLLCANATVFASILLQTFTFAKADLCYDYSYVNLGNMFSGGDSSVNIACLDDEGCWIVYVQARCQGCFDPTCIDGEARVERRVELGKVITIEGSLFASTGISDGDLVCSSGQLSIISSKGNSGEMVHEWSRASLAGMNFAYGAPGNSPSTCLIYSFEGSTVTLAAEGVSKTSIAINPHNYTVHGAFLASATPIKISSSDKPVIVACSQANGYAYTNVYPVSNRPVYGFNSQLTVGHHVDCTDLDSVLPGLTPDCEDAFEISVSTETHVLEQMFAISLNSLPHYSGPSMTCTPSQGYCIAMTTTGDGTGFDGTAWVPDSYFSSFFVLPFRAQQITIFGETRTEKCEIMNNLGVVLSTVNFFGTSNRVQFNNIDTQHDHETLVSCFGGRVAIIAQYNHREAILNGRETPTVWNYGVSLSSCIPTLAPTFSPSSRPTRGPRVAPIPMDGQMRGAVVVSLSSVALLLTVSGLLVDMGKLGRRKRRELVRLQNEVFPEFARSDSMEFEMGVETML